MATPLFKNRLTVTRVRPGDPQTSYPRYIGGEQNAPPEDCGGLPGFYDMLDALDDPDHPNHADAQEWAEDMTRIPSTTRQSHTPSRAS